MDMFRRGLPAHTHTQLPAHTHTKNTHTHTQTLTHTHYYDIIGQQSCQRANFSTFLAAGLLRLHLLLLELSYQAVAAARCGPPPGRCRHQNPAFLAVGSPFQRAPVAAASAPARGAA